MTRKELFATIMVGLMTVTVAYATDTPDASTPAPKPPKHAKKKATQNKDDPKAIAAPAQK